MSLILLKHQNSKEVANSGSFTQEQITTLAKLVEEINFLELKDQLPKPEDLPGDAAYTIVVRLLPEDADPTLAYPDSYSVKCYETRCTSEFLKLKDKIIEFWGKKV